MWNILKRIIAYGNRKMNKNATMVFGLKRVKGELLWIFDVD